MITHVQDNRILPNYHHHYYNYHTFLICSDASFVHSNCILYIEAAFAPMALIGVGTVKT